MPHALRAALLVCLLALPGRGIALAFDFTGTIEGVRDDYDSLDATVAVGLPVSGTYQVDLSTQTGGNPFAVGPAHLVFSLGGYLFDASQNPPADDPHVIALLDNTGPEGSPVDIWQAQSPLSDLEPATTNHGTGFVGYIALIEFLDYSGMIFDANPGTAFVPDGLPGWSEVRITLSRLQDDGGGPTLDNHVQVGVNITSWTPVPEPRSAALLALGLVSLALRARRRARAR